MTNDNGVFIVTPCGARGARAEAAKTANGDLFCRRLLLHEMDATPHGAGGACDTYFVSLVAPAPSSSLARRGRDCAVAWREKYGKMTEFVGAPHSFCRFDLGILYL